MKPQVTILSLLLLIFWLQLSAQKVDLTLKFNPQIAEYEVYAKPDFTKGEFLVAPSSQITVLIPAEFINNKLIVKSIAGGDWKDQSPIFAPESFPTRDFHTFVTEGGTMDFQAGQAQRLFSFSLPIGYDSKEIRLFANGFDPLPKSKGMNGRNLANYFANDISLTDFYGINYGIQKEIKGNIKDWRGYPLEGVDIKIDNQKSTSLYDGRFAFENIPVTNEVVIHFQKKIDPLAGVSTADIIVLQQHLSGEQKFDQPYQWIAADIDGSGKVTIDDLTLLQEILAQPNSAAAQNLGWQYIPTDWLNSGVVHGYGEKVKLSYPERAFAIDFTAIKLGDINGSYTLKPSIPNNIQPSAKSLTINLLNIKMMAGQSYTIPFSTTDLKTVTGYQLSVNTENAVIGDVFSEQGTLMASNLEQINNKLISVNWLKKEIKKANARAVAIKNNLPSNTHESDTNLFNLTVTPTKNGYLSDFVSIIDHTVPTEAYDENGRVMKIQFLFQLAPEEEGNFALYQNTPNPFKEFTTISYFLPNDSPVTLTLTDEEGEIINVMKEDGKKGFNNFNIEGAEVKKGLIYFKIETNFGVETKKMVHLN